MVQHIDTDAEASNLSLVLEDNPGTLSGTVAWMSLEPRSPWPAAAPPGAFLRV